MMIVEQDLSVFEVGDTPDKEEILAACPECSGATRIVARWSEGTELVGELACGCITKNLDWMEALLVREDAWLTEQHKLHVEHMAKCVCWLCRKKNQSRHGSD